MSVFGIILVRIFPHSDWIRRNASISRSSVQIGRGRGSKKDQNSSKYWHFFTQYNMWNNTNYWLWRHGIISEHHLPHQKFSSTQKHNDLQFILSIFFSFFLLFFFFFFGISGNLEQGKYTTDYWGANII